MKMDGKSRDEKNGTTEKREKEEDVAPNKQSRRRRDKERDHLSVTVAVFPARQTF